MTDVADADQNGGIAAVHAEDIGDLAAERNDIVSVALLAELPEAAEVLTDLRRCESHLTTQFTGRDPLHTGSAQIVQLAEIARHSANDIIGYFDSFHSSLLCKKVLITDTFSLFNANLI